MNCVYLISSRSVDIDAVYSFNLCMSHYFTGGQLKHSHVSAYPHLSAVSGFSSEPLPRSKLPCLWYWQGANTKVCNQEWFITGTDII